MVELLSNKKERSSGTHYMYKAWEFYAKWKKARYKKTNIVWLHLYKMSRIDKIKRKKVN